MMMVKTLGIPVDEKAEYTGYVEDAPLWLRPYLAAALRSGLTAGLPAQETGEFGADVAITGGEAAVMLQNAMDLAVTTVVDQGAEDVPQWAAVAVAAMSESGIQILAAEDLTRGEAAKLLYQVSLIAQDAPGLAMYQ